MFKIWIFTDFSKQPRYYCRSYSLMFEPSAGILWRHPTSKWKLISKSVYRLRDEWSYGGIKLTWKTNVLVDKRGIVPLRPPQIQYGLIRNRNLTSVVRGLELTATARTSKSNLEVRGSKIIFPRRKMLTEMYGGCREQIYWCRFAYISLTVFLYFIAIKWPQIWVYLTLPQSRSNAQIMGSLEH